MQKQLEDNAKLQVQLAGVEDDPVREALLKAIAAGTYTFEDLIIYDQTGKLPVEDESLAKGGRVGFSEGGSDFGGITEAVEKIEKEPKTFLVDKLKVIITTKKIFRNLNTIFFHIPNYYKTNYSKD